MYSEPSISTESLNWLKQLYFFQNKDRKLKALLNLFKNEMKRCDIISKQGRLNNIGLNLEKNSTFNKFNNNEKRFTGKLTPLDKTHMKMVVDEYGEKKFYREKARYLNHLGKVEEKGGERIDINVNINYLRGKVFDDNAFYSDNNGLALIDGLLFLMPCKNEKYYVHEDKLIYGGKQKKYIYLHHTNDPQFITSIPK